MLSVLKAWITARQAKDYSKFAPVLQEWVELIRERSKFIDASKPCYDVALQDFEKGMSTARLDDIFSEVKAMSSLTHLFLNVLFPLQTSGFDEDWTTPGFS